MDIAALSQSTDLVGAMRYTTKLPAYLAAGLPLIATDVPAAYDLDDGWLWRLGGKSPWDPTPIAALCAFMRRVNHEAVATKRRCVPRDLEMFNPLLQQTRVCAFVRETITQ